MYHGWAGSPQWLPRYLDKHGEGYYESTMDEMFIISFFALGLIVLAVLVFQRLCKRQNGVTSQPEDSK